MERGQVYVYPVEKIQTRRFNKCQKVPRIFDEDTLTNTNVSLPLEITRPEYLENITTLITNRNMWTWETNVEDFTPEEIKIKVDPVYNTLTLSGKRQAIRRRGGRFDEELKPTNVFKRVVSLPENVTVHQLKAIMTEEGKLLLTAPYMTIRGGETKPWNVPMPLEKESCMEKLSMNEMKTNLPVSQYLRLLKSFNFPGTIGAECVKDEITGEWKLMIDLDTVGFRPEEIRVKFNDEERCLIVRAQHEVVGLGKNVFHHEFVLPEYIKENELKWRILNNGVLRIEMPCERETIREKGINKIYRH